MKNLQIAYLVAALGAAMFLYQIHQISKLNEEASVWRSQSDAHDNPGAGTYVRAFFDGFTLGAFANGDIFSEANKSEREGRQLDALRASIVSRYGTAVSYRNWGFIISIFAGWVAYKLRKNTPKTIVRL